jgi:precorrin-3B synthase
MQTGDGLLARLAPGVSIPIDCFVELCAASASLGNGIIEVTQRGSIQLRGLTVNSAPILARRLTAMGLGDESKPTLLTPPLLGLDATQPCQLSAIMTQLRDVLKDRPYLSSLGPKVSVLVDSDSALHLDAITADIRLRAMSATAFHVSIGGTAHTATPIGCIDAQRVVAVVDELLERIAAQGSATGANADVALPARWHLLKPELRSAPLLAERSHAVRVRRHAQRSALTPTLSHDAWERGQNGPSTNVSAVGLPPRPTSDIDAWRVSLTKRIEQSDAPPQRPTAQPIGQHPLQDDRMALGVALAFGYATADVLQHFARSAARLGADAIQPTAGRVLLVVGVTRVAAKQLTAIAADAGLIVDPLDVRRHVYACAGAPACTSASLPTRELATAVADAAKSWLDSSTPIHLSGCGKGCAHPGAAALTITGPDRLIIDGRASDEPQAIIPSHALIAGFERLRVELSRAQRDESAVGLNAGPNAALLSYLGSARLIECLTGGAPPYASGSVE